MPTTNTFAEYPLDDFVLIDKLIQTKLQPASTNKVFHQNQHDINNFALHYDHQHMQNLIDGCATLFDLIDDRHTKCLIAYIYANLYEQFINTWYTNLIAYHNVTEINHTLAHTNLQLQHMYNILNQNQVKITTNNLISWNATNYYNWDIIGAVADATCQSLIHTNYKQLSHNELSNDWYNYIWLHIDINIAGSPALDNQIENRIAILQWIQNLLYQLKDTKYIHKAAPIIQQLNAKYHIGPDQLITKT